MEDDVMRIATTCAHAGSGVASIRTKKIDILATAKNLEDYGARYKEPLDMIILELGRHCRIMIFPLSVKLRCLGAHETPEERVKAVESAMQLVTENLVC